MIINKKLIAASKFNPTEKSHKMTIGDMCEKIRNNKITLPLYQRDLSWSLKKSVDLLNYQLFGKAPVSPISINQISDNEIAVPQVSFISREIIDDALIKADHQSVVDGQQRLTTNYKAYTNHEDFRSIVLDISIAKFRIVSSSIKPNQIPVGILLNKDSDVLKQYLKERNLITELYPILVDVSRKINSYSYTINIAENLSEDEQIEWFEVLNNAGSRVTALQMSFSKLKLYSFDIYSDYINPFRNKIQDYGVEELFSPFTTNVSYPISALNPAYEVIVKKSKHNLNYAPIPSDTKENQITSLDIDSLNKIILLSLNSLDMALKFITDFDLLDKIERMDSVLYLVGYFTFNHDENISEKTSKSLIKWVEETNFTNLSNGRRRKIFENLISMDF